MRISVLFEEPSSHQSPTLDYVNKPTYFEAVPLRIDIGSNLCATVSYMCPTNENLGSDGPPTSRRCCSLVFQVC